MTSEEWDARADIWQARLWRLCSTRLKDTDQTIRIHNRLSRGVFHAVEMAHLCRQEHRFRREQEANAS